MKKIFKYSFIYSFILLFAYFLIPFAKVQAGDFQVDYDIAYAISPTGTTTVTQNVILTNKVSELFAKQYVILVDSDKLKNIIAYDRHGSLQPNITQKEGKTEIRLNFKNPVVGLGKQHKFSLRYDNSDFVQKVGNIWEINIPGVANDPNLGDYSITVDVPNSFGKAAYFWPNPISGNRWTKEQLINGGITAAYGENQAFSLSLAYHLENPSLTSQITEIALPPDTAYQKVIIESLKPEPLSVYRDKDNNWLARYKLGPSENKDIITKLFILITTEPRKNFIETEINEEEYLKEQPYWEINDPKIRELATQFKTPREIYDFVINILNYDYSRVDQVADRLGAKNILTKKEQALCLEFTDLFITLARAAGIPSRQMVGFAYTTNSKLRPLSFVADVLHAWPEYYDFEKKMWIPVDPTWADTTNGLNYFDKLDFNHLVFAIHGLSSNYPYPAGYYRKSGKTSKDVEVRFIDPALAPKTDGPIANLKFPNQVLAGFPLYGNLIVENLSGTSFDDVKIKLIISPFDYLIEKYEAQITPFSSLNIPIRLTNLGNLFAFQKGTVIAYINDESFQMQFTVLPIYLWLGVPCIFTLLTLIIIYIYKKNHVKS